MLKIKSIYATIHDLGYGGYPFKVIVNIELSIGKFNQLCPKIKTKKSKFTKNCTSRNLSELVQKVNNMVYKYNCHIPAFNPSIDSKGSKRSKNGIKTLEFVYFFKNTNNARNLGFKFHDKVNVNFPIYNQYIDLN